MRGKASSREKVVEVESCMGKPPPCFWLDFFEPARIAGPKAQPATIEIVGQEEGC
jgi:hypothetical protein